MARLGNLAGIFLLAFCAVGCAEFRHDSSHFGGYFLTSLVEHVGYRTLTVEEIYLGDEVVVARAKLEQPTRNASEFIGTRFLVASRQYVDAQIKNDMARQKGKYINVSAGPITDVSVNQIFGDTQGWGLWPATLGKLDEEPTFDELKRHILCKNAVQYPSRKVPYRLGDNDLYLSFYYPMRVDTSSFWQEREYLVYQPVPTTLFKCLVVPPAMVIDTAALPVVGIVYFTALLNYSHGHGP